MEPIDQILSLGENYIVPAIILAGGILMLYAILFKTETFLPVVKFIRKSKVLTLFYLPANIYYLLVYRKKPTTDHDWLQMLKIHTIIILSVFVLVFVFILLLGVN